MIWMASRELESSKAYSVVQIYLNLILNYFAMPIFIYGQNKVLVYRTGIGTTK